MLSEKILSLIQEFKNTAHSAPLLLSEAHACDVFEYIYTTQINDLDELEERGVSDFLYYDCADRDARNHTADKVREHAQKLYQKPSGDTFLALFRNIEILTDTSANALLNLFEEVPEQVLILVTSKSPQKIITTLQSRMLMIDGGVTGRGVNPLQEEIDAYVAGRPEKLFQKTLAPSKESKFSREDALWIVSGLQDAIEYGRLPVRHAKKVSETRIQLETTNTIAKYLIDQLLNPRMRRIVAYIFATAIVPATFARTIFEDKFGNGVTEQQLRQGNISMGQIPGTIVAIINNLLSYVGYISLAVILMGSLFYTLGGLNEGLQEKGKNAIKLALLGAIVSWSAWLLVNVVVDNL